MSPVSDEPKRIGNRYRLDERIGVGAMGAVWRSTDELLNRTVAVKELLAAAVPPTADGADALEESRQRILREGRIGARLQHAHVISMFDVVVHDDRPWLVMEYLPSKSLAQMLGEKGPLAPVEVARIGRHVADGLSAAHNAGVVHRDVKPGNVLIGEDGRVKLTDFGVSRAVDDVQLTRTGLIAGTPAFLSPEVARGKDPTAASDMFALGATLYAAVEGKPPFGLDENAYALLHKVATGVVTPPENAGRLTPVIMWLLSTDPDDRPTASQARDALDAVATGRTTEPAPERPNATAVMPADTEKPVYAPSAPVDFSRPTEATTPRSEPAPPTPPPARAASSPTRGRKPLLALLALLVVGGTATVVALTSGSGEETTPQAVPPAVTTVESAPTTTAAPTTTPAPTTSAAAETTTSPPPTSTPPPAGSVDPVSVVQSYYGLLPGNTDAAWGLLSSSAQAVSGGRGSFDRFYGEMQSLSVQNARLSGDNTVSATIVFTRKNGSTSSEAYRFVVGNNNGRGIIESFRRG